MKLSFEDLKQRKEKQETDEKEGKVLLGDVLEEIRQEWRAQRGCPLDEELVAYFDDTLRLKRKLAVRWHVRRCPICRTDLSTLRVAALETDDPQPPPWSEALAWKLAVAASAVALLSSSIAFSKWHESKRLRDTISRQAVMEEVVMDLAMGMPNETASRLERKIGPVMREGSYGAFLNLSRAFVFNEQFGEAIPLLERAKQIRPDQGEPYKLLAAVYKIKANHEESIRNLEALLQQQPQDRDTWNFLGWSYFSLGRYEKAREAYERSLQILPNNPDVLFNLALMEQQQGNKAKYQELLEKARQLLHRGISTSPDSAIAYFHLSKTYAHEKNWGQALNYLKIAIAKDPEWTFWVRHEVFFQEMFKAYPETEKTVAAFANVYATGKVKEILVSLAGLT